MAFIGEPFDPSAFKARGDLRSVRCSDRGQAELSAACDAIRNAAFGEQQDTLNKSAFRVGTLVAAGEIDEADAIAELLSAGRAMPSQPGREPWKPRDIEQRVKRSFAEGKASPREKGSRKAATHNHPWNAIDTYIYRDESGNPLFRIQRTDTKQFPQSSWVDGKWVSGTTGVPKVPYRLPELMQSEQGDLVYIVEGEKDADTLSRLGLIATTNPCGAGKWLEEFADYFVDRYVAILPDNDSPGRNHANKVARSLFNVAAEVRIVELPGLPEKGDVSDWVAAGGTPDELVSLAGATPALTAEAVERLADLKTAEPVELPAANQRQLLNVIDPTTFEGKPIPNREWIVDGWIPIGEVTLLYGEGGTGKSLLAQQLMSACATGTLWCGQQVTPCRSFGLFCEDDNNELLRRQAKINNLIQCSFRTLTDMHWASGVGLNNIMMKFNRQGDAVLTDWFEQIRDAAMSFGARLVIIDTAAAVFGGNENDRGQVTQFIGVAMARLAQDIGGAVLMTAHPSRSGITTGSLDSGSTGWSGSARSRLSFERPQDGDKDERVLSRKKANYASIGERIELRWKDGVLEPKTMEDVSRSENQKHEAVTEAGKLFLELLEKTVSENLRLSASKNSANYAPKIMVKHSGGKRFNTRQFEAAMYQLLDSGMIENIPYGKPSDQRFRLVRASSDHETERDDEAPEVAANSNQETSEEEI